MKVKESKKLIAAELIGDTGTCGLPAAGDITHRLQLAKAELLSRVEALGARLPPNTLDELIEKLGGTSMVAEVRFSPDFIKII